MTYVYLLKGNENFYKIGITQNISSRLKNINNSNHDSVSVVTCWLVEDAIAVERMLHTKYAQQRTKAGGEWFKFTPEEALEVCMEIHRVPGFTQKPIEREMRETARTLATSQSRIEEEIGIIRREIERIKSPKQNTIVQQEQPKLIEKKSKVNDDELMQHAREVILKYDTASTSFLQRKLSVGFARAARIMDKLEEEGFISNEFPRRVLGKLII